MNTNESVNASSKQQLIADIMALAVTTQYSSGRCIFVDFSGHIDKLSISVRESQDHYGKELASREFQLTPYTYPWTTSEDIEEFEDNLVCELNEAKQMLLSFIPSTAGQEQLRPVG